MTNGIKPKAASSRGLQCSDILTAAIKNIQLHMDFSDGIDNHHLTDFAIPQLEEVIARLKR